MVPFQEQCPNFNYKYIKLMVFKEWMGGMEQTDIPHFRLYWPLHLLTDLCYLFSLIHTQTQQGQFNGMPQQCISDKSVNLQENHHHNNNNNIQLFYQWSTKSGWGGGKQQTHHTLDFNNCTGVTITGLLSYTC